MNVLKKLYVKLPAAWQDRIMELLMKNGMIFQAPVFGMLMRSLEFFGGDLEEIRNAFTSPANKRRSALDIARQLGSDLRKRAEEAERSGESSMARALYHRAAIYFLLGDWYTYDRTEIAKNYDLLNPCYDKFRQLAVPPIEKIQIPFDTGLLTAYYRVPWNRGNGPFPAVVMVQGNDEVKEFNHAFENMALERGLATLNIDPPGWGESGVTGNRFDSAESYQKAMRLAVDFLVGRKEVNGSAIGVFGVSFGGLLAPVAAGLEPRIAAVAGMGGPILNINQLRRNVPKAQANRAYLYTGAKGLPELEAWTDKMDFAGIISKIRCPVLIVHGDEDELVGSAHARKIIELVKGEKHLRIVPGGDHMCTHALREDVGPFIFRWLSERLNKTV